MSYNQPTYTNYNDARMGGNRPPPRQQEQDPRYNGQGGRQNPVGSRPVYQQAPVGYAHSAAHVPAPGLGAPLSLPQPAPAPAAANSSAYGVAHGNLPVFPPHPDTKPRAIPQNNMPVYQQQNMYQPRMNIQELVQVPPELASFASDPQFQQILLRVKEQTAINFISLNRSPTSPDCVESISIDAPSRESAQLARGLIETHFKLQAKLKHAETRLQKVQTDLFSAQGEIASGMMIEFSIDPELVGLALGKKGARIKQIEHDTKVTSINVTGETGRIMVVGPDSQSVQRARELLELQEECIPLESHQIEWLSNKYNSGFLHDIKSGSDLIVTRVNSEKFTLDIVGTVQAVRSARFMLSTQLEYVEKQIEIEASERAARDKLQQVRKQYGMGGGRYDNENRERGDRGDRNDRNNNNNRERNNNNDRTDRGDRRDRDQGRDRNSAPTSNPQTNTNTNGRGSRAAGQDSMVNLNSNTAAKKVGSSAQAVADAVGNAYKKPSSSTPAAAASETKAARGQSNAQSNNSRGGDKKDTSVPMLQQVLQNNKKDAKNPPATSTANASQQSRGGQKKVDVDTVTEGVKNLKVDNAQKNNNQRGGNKSEKTDTKPVAADSSAAKPVNNNDKRRNNNKTAEPAAPAVSRVVEVQDAPLPKRQNNRNKKAVDSLVTVGAGAVTTPPAAAAATVSSSESATEGEGESKRRRPVGNRKNKAGEASPATLITADSTTADAAPAKEAAGSKMEKTAKPSRSTKGAEGTKEANKTETAEQTDKPDKADKVEKNPVRTGTPTPPGLPSPGAATKSAAVPAEVVPIASVTVSGPPAVPIAVAVASADQA